MTEPGPPIFRVVGGCLIGMPRCPRSLVVRDTFYHDAIEDSAAEFLIAVTEVGEELLEPGSRQRRDDATVSTSIATDVLLGTIDWP